MIRIGIAFVAAVAVMVVLGSLSHSLFVQAAWMQAAGAESIPYSDRVSWILHDIVGLQPLYAGLVSAALLIAFLVASLVGRFAGLRTILLAGAGAFAIFVMYTLMRSQLGTVGVFGARGTWGLSAQMTAGLLAGLTFAWMSRSRKD